ncbi:MAG: BON domain-containing protein [Betaproteobacteria bacterium]|nr:BON domain-containing protein [Betaproteobacteria bacterium]
MMALLSRLSSRRAVIGALFVIAAALPLSGCFEAVVGGAAVTGVLVGTDRRTADAQLGDERIGWTASLRIKERFGDQVHVNVSNYNYLVLLTGEVPSAQAKADIERLVSEISAVKSVVNELQVAGQTSLTSRGNDTYITGKVKAAFVNAGKFQANHVKVVTENAVVYLLGMVTRKEADDATEIARSTSGVTKVVRVFDYLAQAPK